MISWWGGEGQAVVTSIYWRQEEYYASGNPSQGYRAAYINTLYTYIPGGTVTYKSASEFCSIVWLNVSVFRDRSVRGGCVGARPGFPWEHSHFTWEHSHFTWLLQVYHVLCQSSTVVCHQIWWQALHQADYMRKQYSVQNMYNNIETQVRLHCIKQWFDTTSQHTYLYLNIIILKFRNTFST